MRKTRLVLIKSRKTCVALISCILVALIPLPRLFWQTNGWNRGWNKGADSSYIILCPDHVYPLPPDITKKQSKSHIKRMRLIIQNKNNGLTFGHWATEKYRWTTLLTTLHFYIPNLFGPTSGDDQAFSWFVYQEIVKSCKTSKTNTQPPKWKLLRDGRIWQHLSRSILQKSYLLYLAFSVSNVYGCVSKLGITKIPGNGWKCLNTLFCLSFWCLFLGVPYCWDAPHPYHSSSKWYCFQTG